MTECCQRDQIWRNFANLAEFQKSLAISLGFMVFGKSLNLLGNF